MKHYLKSCVIRGIHLFIFTCILGVSAFIPAPKDHVVFSYANYSGSHDTKVKCPKTGPSNGGTPYVPPRNKDGKDPGNGAQSENMVKFGRWLFYMVICQYLMQTYMI